MPECRTWIPFREFFARADRSGLSRVDAAQALLRNIKAPSAADKVLGIRRKWEFVAEAPEERRKRSAAQCWRHFLSDIVDAAGGVPTPEQIAAFVTLNEIIDQEHEEWRELPINLDHRPLPEGSWSYFESANAKCEAVWRDDEEKPSHWEFADLIRGTYEYTFHWFDREEWHSLEIEEAFAELIISRPTEIVAPYSLRELMRLAKRFKGNSVTFWEMVRDSKRKGRILQDDSRLIWNHVRHRKAVELPGQGKKRGRPRKAG